VKDVREEHRRAIDWLNENTSEEIGFYLLKIELWQIADSPLAPKFEIISKPNDWAKTVKSSTDNAELTQTKVKQLQFWDAFKDFAKKENTTLRFQKSYPQHWTNISIGSSSCYISLTISSKENVVGCELYIPDDKDLYTKLFESKDAIENELQEIKLSMTGEFVNEAEWEKYFEWMKNKAEKFQVVFPKYI
jgi:hypothetical protein